MKKQLCYCGRQKKVFEAMILKTALKKEKLLATFISKGIYDVQIIDEALQKVDFLNSKVRSEILFNILAITDFLLVAISQAGIILC